MTFKKKLLLIALPLLMIAATPLASTRVQQALKEMISDQGRFITFSLENDQSPVDGQVVKFNTDGTITWENDAGASGGDSVSINSVSVVDPDFVSTGQVGFTDTTNTVTADINADSILEVDLNATNAPTDNFVLSFNAAGSNFTWAADAGGAETNSLETTITGILDTEVYIGTGADTGNFKAFTGDISLSNAGVTAVQPDSVALTTDTTGNYSTGNAEAGDALVSIAAEITDNEATAEENPMVFVAGADPDGGDLPLETDGTCTYNPSTGEITTTGFVGALTGNADTVTTNANLTGPITSVGNATSIAAQTGTGSTFVVNTSPTLVTPVLGVATATTINKVTLTSPATAATITATDGTTTTLSGGTHSGTNTGDVAETNSLEVVTTGIATTEIPIGTAPDTAVYAALSGDATMDNAGVVTVVDDLHAHTTTSISGLVNADLSGSAGITNANLALTAGRSLTIVTDDIAADAELFTVTKTIIIETPTSADNFIMFHVELGMQVTAAHAIVEDATNATVQFLQCDSAGDNCTEITSPIVAVVTGAADDGVIDAPDLDIDDWIRCNITATTGTPGHVTATLTMTMDD